MEAQAEVSTAPDDLGGRAWELMFEVFKSAKAYMEVVAAGLDMTPQQVYALKSLTNERPMAMSELASSLGCDASNVTALVDKLESRGLVERRSTDRDRRVKSLIMTEAGVALRARIQERMKKAPAAIENLTSGDKVALCEILSRAVASLE